MRFDASNVLEVLNGLDTLVVLRGKKVETVNLKAGRPIDDELKSKLLGPTGNLRAPTARVGNTLLVGFNEEAYRETLIRGDKPHGS